MKVHDAIVVGAGLSGLTCARRLADAGRDVVVVEASERVGGRLHSGVVGGAVVDLGGQWLSVSQPRLLALARELGVASVPQPRAGRAIFDDAGRGHGFVARAGTLFSQLWAVHRIGRRIAAVTRDPAAHAALDQVRLATWLDSHVGNAVARDRLAMHAELVLAADLADVSLLAYLARLGATGGFSPRGPDLPGGGRDHRFVGGAAQLADRLAAGLDVRLASPVLAIAAHSVRSPDTVVRLPDGELHARDVVLALPPALAARIASPLPAEVRAAAHPQRGAVIKVFAAYATPFWRAAGLSGEAYRPRGTLRAVVDASPPDGSVGVLLGFIVGPHAEAWHTRDPHARRAEVLAAFAELFDAPPPIDYLEADWATAPFAAGCVAVTPPGAFPGAWRGSFGHLHLAGTETATHWPGYMEGAIAAGDRAAAAILASPPRSAGG